MDISMNTSLCKSVNRISTYLHCFGHATVDAGWKGDVLSPVFSRLYYIVDGAFSVTDASGEYILKKGSWYLIPAGYSFSYKCREKMEHFFTHVKLCDFDGTDLLQNCHIPLSIEDRHCNIKFLTDCVKSESDTDGLLLRQRVTEILLEFVKKYNVSISTEDYSPFVYKAITYIRQNLSMQLTVSEISEYVFVSKSTLTKHFRKELSLSVNEYICNTVLSEAERLITSTDTSLLEISRKLGFSDQFYFSRKFKERFGKSPREYRKNQLL